MPGESVDARPTRSIPALNPSAPADFTQILTPAFLHITTDPQLHEAFMREDGHELMVDYLRLSWETERDEEERLIGPMQLLVNMVVSGEAQSVREFWEQIWIVGKDVCAMQVPRTPTPSKLLFAANCLLLLLLLSRTQAPKELATITSSARRWFDWFDGAKNDLVDTAEIEEVVEIGKAVLQENAMG